MIYRPLPHIIGDIVGGLAFYDYGAPNEIVNKLKLKSDAATKYPLIWYMIDGSVKQEVGSKYTKCNCTIIICNETSKDFSAAERYENNFIPILRPLYEGLMARFEKSLLVRSPERYVHTYYENLFWGKEGLYGHTGNVFDDMLDAIIIENLQFFIIEKC